MSWGLRDLAPFVTWVRLLGLEQQLYESGLGNPQLQAQPTDPPDIGAVCQYLRLGPTDLPGAVCLPCFPGWGEEGYRRGGPYGGSLGSQYDPVFSLCKPAFGREPKTKYYDPVMPVGEPFLPGLDSLPEMPVVRFWDGSTTHLSGYGVQTVSIA